MKLLSFVVGSVIATSLVGCFNQRTMPQIPASSEYSKKLQAGGASKDALYAAASEDFRQAIVFCRGVLNNYERAGKEAEATKLSVGAIGAVAGGIIAPALTAGGAGAGAIAAWSGLSGVSNSLLVSSGSGPLDTTFFMGERLAIAHYMRSKIPEIIAETDAAKKSEKSLAMMAGCISSGFTEQADTSAVEAQASDTAGDKEDETKTTTGDAAKTPDKETESTSS